MSENLLFICGSLNQTRIMHKISAHLADFNCYFTPFYADGLIGNLSKIGLLDFSILGGRHRTATMRYLRQNRLSLDFSGRNHKYALVLTCTDLIIQKNVRDNRLILVQEGITEPENLGFHLVRALKFPRLLANTSATGLSNAFDVFCVASPGYRDHFIQIGVNPQKIIVTGLPNFDDTVALKTNDFSLKGYVLVATSSIRETLKFDDRIGFLRNTQKITAGRKVIFKLHPNEDHIRAEREIRSIFPDAVIFTNGDIDAMIANCDVLITQVSSVAFLAMALGKEVHSYFSKESLQRLLPVQNGGRSALHIADVVRSLMSIPLHELRREVKKTPVFHKWLFSDGI